MTTNENLQNKQGGSVGKPGAAVWVIGALLAAILVCSITVQLIFYPEKSANSVRVIDLLPASSAATGWTVEMKPIADSFEMAQKVESILNYDDVLLADLRKGRQRVSIFIAYWQPGKMPQRDVAAHTPDVCWVEAGWSCLEAVEDADISPNHNRRLMPTRARTMEFSGHKEYVWFWHIFGGQVRSYQKFGRPPWYAIITDTLKQGLNQRQEQYFIRISSSEPLDAGDGWLSEALADLLTEKDDAH